MTLTNEQINEIKTEAFVDGCSVRAVVINWLGYDRYQDREGLIRQNRPLINDLVQQVESRPGE